CGLSSRWCWVSCSLPGSLASGAVDGNNAIHIGLPRSEQSSTPVASLRLAEAKARVKAEHALRLLGRKIFAGLGDVVDAGLRLFDGKQGGRGGRIDVQRRRPLGSIASRVRPIPESGAKPEPFV